MNKLEEVKPYSKEGGKKQQVNQMFDAIAPKYDFLNHFLSLGIDNIWRKKALKRLKDKRVNNLLDIACGTGDFSFEALKQGIPNVTGVDLSEQMLSFADKKASDRNLKEKVTFQRADAENLPFDSDSFDAVTVAFGVRNFEDLEKGLTEIKRVLKDDGTCIILEFSKPTGFPFKQLFTFYFKLILPSVGRIISKDNRAYSYLPESVEAFPEGENFSKIIESLNFRDVNYKKLTFGVASIYYGTK